MSYVLTEKRLLELLYAERMLTALEEQGVDNWPGYAEVDWEFVVGVPDLSSLERQ